jgi:hypothetical protein
MQPHVRRTIFTAAKVALAIGIVSFLVYQGQDAYSKLSANSIHWPLLCAALGFTVVTVSLGFVRWHLLIRALGIDMRVVETMRLGALGYALNYVSPGSIGGDFFKAVFLAHGQPGRRTEAIATVVADRVIGLLTMLILASVGILSTGLLGADSQTIRVMCRSILLMSAVAWTGFIMLLFVKSLTGEWVRRQVLRLRFTGHALNRLLDTVQVYREEKRMLAAAFCVSVVMALCYITSFYMVARALPIHAPSWAEHLTIVPVASLVGATIPTPSGVGPTEYAIEELYRRMPGGNLVAKGDGTLVGLGRRLTDIAVALVGFGFYLINRREVQQVMQEAEELAESGALE